MSATERVSRPLMSRSFAQSRRTLRMKPATVTPNPARKFLRSVSRVTPTAAARVSTSHARSRSSSTHRMASSTDRVSRLAALDPRWRRARCSPAGEGGPASPSVASPPSVSSARRNDGCMRHPPDVMTILIALSRTQNSHQKFVSATRGLRAADKLSLCGRTDGIMPRSLASPAPPLPALMVSTHRHRIGAASAAIAIHVAVGAAMLRTHAPTEGLAAGEGGSQTVMVVELVSLASTDGGDSPASAGQAPHAPPAAAVSPSPTTVPDPAPHDATPSAASPSESPGDGNDIAASAVTGGAAPYRDLLLSHVRRYREYPLEARLQRAEGTARVRFILDREGRVQRVWLDDSSGHDSLDEAALAAIRRADPFPPPPRTASPYIDIILPISFDLR